MITSPVGCCRRKPASNARPAKGHHRGAINDRSELVLAELTLKGGAQILSRRIKIEYEVLNPGRGVVDQLQRQILNTRRIQALQHMHNPH